MNPTPRIPASSENVDPHTLRLLVHTRARALVKRPPGAPASVSLPSCVILWADRVDIRYGNATPATTERLSHTEFLARYKV